MCVELSVDESEYFLCFLFSVDDVRVHDKLCMCEWKAKVLEGEYSVNCCVRDFDERERIVIGLRAQ